MKCIIPIVERANSAPLIATFGRGYRSLIKRFTESNELDDHQSHDKLSSSMYALIYKAEHWNNF